VNVSENSQQLNNVLSSVQIKGLDNYVMLYKETLRKKRTGKIGKSRLK